MTITFSQTKRDLERAALACAFRGHHWCNQVVTLCADWVWETGFHAWLYGYIKDQWETTREGVTVDALGIRCFDGNEKPAKGVNPEIVSAFLDDLPDISNSPTLTLRAMASIARQDTLRRTSSAVLDAIDDGRPISEITALFEEGKTSAIASLTGDDEMVDWFETAEDRIKECRQANKDKTKKRFDVPLAIARQATRGGLPAAGRVVMIMGDTNAGKCLSGDTMIALANGDRKRIDSLSGGTDVLAFDGEKFVVKTAEWIDNGVKEVFEVVTSSGRTIKATANHPFLTGEGWVPLEELAKRIVENYDLFLHFGRKPFWGKTKKNTSVFCVDKHVGVFEDPIVSIRNAGFERVYDLCVPDLHNFVANEIVVHNSSLAAAFGFHAAMTPEIRPVVLHVVTEELKEDLHARYDAQVVQFDRGELVDGLFSEDDEKVFIKRIRSLDDIKPVVKHVVLPMGAVIHEVRPRIQLLRARYPGRPILTIIDSPDYLNSGKKNIELRHDISAVYQTMKSWVIDPLLAPMSLLITTQVSGQWEGKLPPIGGASESRDKGRIVDLGIALRETGEVKGRDGWKSFELGINKNRIGKLKNCLVDMVGDLGTCTYESTSPLKFLSEIAEEQAAEKRREAARKR